LAGTTLPARVKHFFQRAGVIPDVEEEGVEEESAEEEADEEWLTEVESIVGRRCVKPQKDWGLYVQLP
jgi:hypothetical protein